MVQERGTDSPQRRRLLIESEGVAFGSVRSVYRQRTAGVRFSVGRHARIECERRKLAAAFMVRRRTVFVQKIRLRPAIPSRRE